eukprot:1159770-Pelagomonas_calceolata.AAC.6
MKAEHNVDGIRESFKLSSALLFFSIGSMHCCHHALLPFFILHSKHQYTQLAEKLHAEKSAPKKRRFCANQKAACK